MQAKTARHSVGAIAFFFLLALLPHFIGPDPAMAFGSILAAWNNLYAPGGVGSQSGANASCALCHDTKTGPSVGYNAYGDLVRQNIGLGNIAAFRAAETANSINASGVTQNIAEINASTQPGWTSGNSNPIFDLTGVAATPITAPAAVGTLDPVAANRPPVANAGPDQAVGVGATVQLNGGQSSDPNLDPLTYSWSFVLPLPAGSGATLAGATTVQPTFVADVAGSYTVQLIVNDGQVNSLPDTVLITAGGGNVAPVANAGPDQAVGVGQTVTLNGGGSTDANNDPLTYAWSFVSRPAGSAATLAGATTVRPTFVADVAGSYTVQLIVNDGQVNSLPDTVVVSTQNLPPVANAGPDQTVTVGTTVTLDGSASSDPEGHALTYRWLLVSQPVQSRVVLANPTTAKLTFVADAPGDFVVGLVVNDGASNSTQTNVVVTVQNAPASDTKNSNCFIATAAFGSPLAPQVQLLREVRDTYLLPYGPGRVLVDWYYAVSPGVADVISRSETLRAVVRFALMPLLGWATLALWSPAIGFGVPLLPIVGVWLVVRRSRRG